MAESIAALGGAIEFTAVSEWDASGQQYRGMRFSTTVDNAVHVASVTAAAIVGVLQNKPTSGRAARIRTSGITKAVAGASITRGDRVDCDAQGYFRTAVGSNYAGYAAVSVVASGTFSLVLNPQYAGAA